MARKPNYRFDRLERERKKAAKKAIKLEAKRAAAADAEDETPDAPAVSANEPANEDGQTDD